MKYLGLKIDENLNWKDQNHDIATKLNRANALLQKIRNYVLRKRALRIINNQPKNSHSGPLFQQNNIIKFQDKILIGNILFVSKSIDNLLPPIFKNWFIFCSEIQNYNTVSLATDKLFNTSYRTDSYAKRILMILSAINCWN